MEEIIAPEYFIEKMKEAIVKELKKKWNASGIEVEEVLKKLGLVAEPSVAPVTVEQADLSVAATSVENKNGGKKWKQKKKHLKK